MPTNTLKINKFQSLLHQKKKNMEVFSIIIINTPKNKILEVFGEVCIYVGNLSL